MKLLALLLSSTVALYAQASAAGTIWTFLGPTTLQSAATANGNGTAMTVAGLSSAIFSVNCSVTCSGGTAINFEGSADGTNFAGLPAVQIGTATIASSVANQASGSVTLWQVPVGAIQSIRARISGYSAGTVTVTATTSAAPYDPKVHNNNIFLGATAADGNSGNKSAATQRVVIATDQPALTNALLVNGSAVTQPVSAASLPLPSGASTAAKQPALGTAGTASADVITVQGIASMTALKVDGSAVTQPVSGTVTANAGTGTMAVSAASLPLPSGASTAAKQPALGTAGTAASDVITIQGIASMTALKVDGSAVTQPVSGTVTANAGSGTMAISAASLPLPTSAATDASVTGLQVSQASTTSGQKGGLALGAVTTAAPSYTTAQSSPLSLSTAGALRVDGSGSTQPVSGTVSITANSAVNVAQINGVTTLMNNGTAGTGSQRVVIASDNSAIANAGQAAIGAAPPTGSVQIAGTASGATAGLLAGITVCDSFANIQQTAGAQIVTGVSGRRIYVCSINLVSATAQNVSVVAGTGTVCATTTVAVPGLSGGATAATGWNLAANGGIAHGGGLGAIAKTTVNADNLCILQSSSGQVSGGISFSIY